MGLAQQAQSFENAVDCAHYMYSTHSASNKRHCAQRAVRCAAHGGYMFFF